MFKKADQMGVTLEPGLKGGRGTTRVVDILTKEEMAGTGRLFGISIIPPGGSIGYHRHTGDFEVYYILSGKARVTLDGEVRVIGPGDMTMCEDGHTHGIENIGDDELRYLAVILYSRREPSCP